MSKFTETAKGVLRASIPLAVRKPLATWLDRQTRIPGKWWSVELLADWAQRDPDAYHRFLWSHHMGYAESYEVSERFGADRIHRSRRLLLEDFEAFMSERGANVATDIRSVLDVGCSMGYLLHYLEQHVAPSVDRLVGIDIDEYAIERGRRELAKLGSKADLSVADMGELDRVLGDERFDLVLCAGVLMYLKRDKALPVVKAMLRHTAGYLVLAGLAQPDRDNRELSDSTVRQSDRSFIHNLDAMVEAAGGTILNRRWEGTRMVQGNTIYFLFCAPGGETAANGTAGAASSDHHREAER